MNNPEELMNAAYEQHRRGQLQTAESLYRQVIALDPRHAEAWNLLGVIQTHQRNFRDAVDSLRRAIAVNPTDAFYHSNLGNAIRETGELDEAVASYHRAIALNHKLALTHFNLAVTLRQLGRRDEAIAAYRRAIESQPDLADAHYNLGNALLEQQAIEDAAVEYRRAVDLQPGFAEAHYGLAIVLRQLGDWQESLAHYRLAVTLQPTFADAHQNLGNLLKVVGHPDEAIAHLRRSLELNPSSPIAHYNLGIALQEAGAHQEAIACYRQATALSPEYSMAAAALVHELQQTCEWDGLPTLARGVVQSVEAAEMQGSAVGVAPFNFVVLPIVTTAQQQLHCARQFVARHVKPAIKSHAPPRRSGARSKLRIGYLSADYHYHATAMLVAELFESHNRQRFEVIGYSYGRPDDSPMRRRLERGLDQFVDLRAMSHTEAARRIASDQVDILVDLKGYTVGARTEILAGRPAPIQVNYLGFPGTMGAPFIDYILVDEFLVPSDQQHYYTERLVHLPGCYQVNDSRRGIAPSAPTRGACGLPDEAFVFCSFNNNYKITPEMFDIWMRLLLTIPRSVLWLLESNPTAAANLRREAATRGVPPGRLVFAQRLPLEEHLARHALADMFLDTFPVNAHTTASEALWSGCPLVTLSGQTLVSRVAGSLLRALDMPELITTSFDQYEHLARQLASDPDRLAELRQRLAVNRTTAALFDGKRFTLGLERAYETMWATYDAGRPPCSFAITAEP